MASAKKKNHSTCTAATRMDKNASSPCRDSVSPHRIRRTIPLALPLHGWTKTRHLHAVTVCLFTEFCLRIVTFHGLGRNLYIQMLLFNCKNLRLHFIHIPWIRVEQIRVAGIRIGGRRFEWIYVGYACCDSYVSCEIHPQFFEEPCDETSFGEI